MDFFEETENLARSRTIIESMVSLANRLCMPVIAEGVEKKEQVEYLNSVGCDVVQGYYFSKPMSVEEYEGFMEHHESEDIRELIRALKEKEKQS
jgi:EAL domain-containing protein (putative c-di-GMP-specific phosphodiesterase class I)